MATELPARFELLKDQATKQLAVVVEIEGLATLISNRPIYKRIRYGDAGLKYGTPGLVYGGLTPIPGVMDILDYEASSISIAQSIEPENGSSTIQYPTLSIVDRNHWFTGVISGAEDEVDAPADILNRKLKIHVGYIETAWPEDYLTIFRGRISDVDYAAGKYTVKVSDPNIVRRQSVFFSAKTTLSAGIDAAVTTISVASNGDFHKQILGPAGTYDTAVKTFLRIEDEWIEYTAAGFGTNQFTSVTRGALGSTAAAHDAGAEVSAAVQIEDHAIDMALKLQLSGHNGPWISDLQALAVGMMPDGTAAASAIVLRSKVDAKDEYGLIEGDYITVSGCVDASNNKTVRLVRIDDLGDEKNRILYTDSTFTGEMYVPVLAFRSQYDTYPVTCGAGMATDEVDVEGHLDVKNTYLSATEYKYRFLLSSEQRLKSFIEQEILKPFRAYTLTRRGRLSVGITKPPVADPEIVFLTVDNITDPQTIRVSRGLNNRKFYNEVHFNYDQDTDGEARALLRYIDANSQGAVGVVNAFKIDSKGARSDLGVADVFERIARSIVSRFGRAAFVITLKTNWGAGSLIEAGDVVALKDDGALQLVDFTNSERDIGTRLFEVVERSLDIKSGACTVKLVSGIGVDVTDRYATVSPSSLTVSGASNYLVLKDSFSKQYPGDEMRKWRNFAGQPIWIHSTDFTYSQETTIAGFDTAEPYKMYIEPLAVAPASYEGLVVDVPVYPDDGARLTNSAYKNLFAFLSPSVAVASGISDKAFTVSEADAGKFFVGARVIVAKYSAGAVSPEVEVTYIDGQTIHVKSSLGFVPDDTYTVEGIGFNDGLGFYRIL